MSPSLFSACPSLGSFQPQQMAAQHSCAAKPFHFVPLLTSKTSLPSSLFPSPFRPMLDEVAVRAQRRRTCLALAANVAAAATRPRRASKAPHKQKQHFSGTDISVTLQNFTIAAAAGECRWLASMPAWPLHGGSLSHPRWLPLPLPLPLL